MGCSKGFSTASKKYWIKNVKNGENYSVTSRCTCISLSVGDILSSFVTVLHNSDAYFVKEHILLDQAEVRFRIETYFLVQIFKNNDSLIVFLCHINDQPDTVKSSVRLFADDCLLYREINSQNDHNKVQKDLENLEKWAENWGMRFNATKCYIMSIKKKTHTFDQLGGHILDQVDSNLYLGLQIQMYQKTSNGVHTYRTSQRRPTQPEIYNIVQRNAGKMPTSH